MECLITHAFLERDEAAICLHRCNIDTVRRGGRVVLRLWQAGHANLPTDSPHLPVLVLFQFYLGPTQEDAAQMPGVGERDQWSV